MVTQPTENRGTMLQPPCSAVVRHWNVNHSLFPTGANENGHAICNQMQGNGGNHLKKKIREQKNFEPPPLVIGYPPVI